MLFYVDNYIILIGLFQLFLQLLIDLKDEFLEKHYRKTIDNMTKQWIEIVNYHLIIIDEHIINHSTKSFN